MDITRQKQQAFMMSGLPLLGNPDTRKSEGLSPETGLRQFCFQTVEEKKKNLFTNMFCEPRHTRQSTKMMGKMKRFSRKLLSVFT